MKAALQEAEEAEEGEGVDGTRIQDSKGKPILSDEEKAKKEEKARKKAAEKAAARAERVHKLVENLERKLGIFTESATGVSDEDVTRSWRTICQLEAEELSHESYGPELLQAIGFVYTSKAKHFLATNQTFLGVGGWLHNVQGKYHVFSETSVFFLTDQPIVHLISNLAVYQPSAPLSSLKPSSTNSKPPKKPVTSLLMSVKSSKNKLLKRVSKLSSKEPNSKSNRSYAKFVIGSWRMKM